MNDERIDSDEELEKLAAEALRTRTSRSGSSATVFDRVKALEKLFRSLANAPQGPALVYREVGGAIRAHLLGSDPTVIGREPSCTLAFPTDAWMSRRHCLVCREQDGFLLRDLNSRNGTFLQEKVRVAERLLLSGDSFKAGEVRFYFVDAPTR